MTAGVERILERAAALARSGLKNPLTVLVTVAESEHGDSPSDATKALVATMRAAGGSLVRWYGMDGKHRKLRETVALFEDALFELRVGG